MSLASIAVPLLAATFLGAAIAKLRAATQFRSVLRDLVPDSLVRFIGRAIPLAELLVAIGLLSGVAPTASAVASILLLALFSAALFRMWQLGLTQDCACFGESTHSATPASGLARNALLAAAAIAAVVLPEQHSRWSGDWESVALHAVAVAGLSVLWVVGQTLMSRHQLLFKGRMTS